MSLAASSLQATVSPRFESLLGRSNSVAWSPAPIDGIRHENSSDFMPGTKKFNSKVADSWMVNNAESKTSDQWGPTQTPAARSQVWSPTRTHSPVIRSDLLSPSGVQTKTTETWTNNNNNNYNSNTLSKTTDSPSFNQSSSTLPMLKK